ncbi:MAG: PTS sugar transporter subunit IIA [Deltaproteobacteria bacterium]|nr:PTS sugar transporter subunit IIA [Deltaproteobacteria bacterium]
MDTFRNLPEELILLDVEAEDKEDLFVKVAARLCMLGCVDDEYELVESLVDREEIMSTGIGLGVAFPHAELSALSEGIVVIARLKRPIKFGSLDRKPVDVAFVLLTPKGEHDQVLLILETLARMIRDTKLLVGLRGAKDESEVQTTLKESRERVYI